MLSDDTAGVPRERAERAADRDLQTRGNLCRLRSLDRQHPASLAGHSQANLDHVADQLNERPRQTRGWKTPSQALEQALR